MNQGKLEVVIQEMTRVNVDILGISEQNWYFMQLFIINVPWDLTQMILYLQVRARIP